MAGQGSCRAALKAEPLPVSRWIATSAGRSVPTCRKPPTPTVKPEATQRRLREHRVVLIVQDTTEMEFTRHPPKDAQCLNTPDRYGLYEHVLLAVTPNKLTQRGVNGLPTLGQLRQSN